MDRWNNEVFYILYQWLEITHFLRLLGGGGRRGTPPDELVPLVDEPNRFVEGVFEPRPGIAIEKVCPSFKL
jgi:hypothetical protein